MHHASCKNEDDLKNENYLKNEDNLKNEDDAWCMMMMHDEKWIKQVYAWSFRQSACVEICVDADRQTNPDTEFKMVRGRTIKKYFTK